MTSGFDPEVIPIPAAARYALIHWDEITNLGVVPLLDSGNLKIIEKGSS
jgi:hypothetical protein